MSARCSWLLAAWLAACSLSMPLADAHADGPPPPHVLPTLVGPNAPGPPPPHSVGPLEQHLRPRWAALTLGLLQVVVVLGAVGAAVIGPTRPPRPPRRRRDAVATETAPP